MRPYHEIEKYFHCRIAIVELGPGETKEDAWSRHLDGHPEDFYANIKIFNLGNRDSQPPRHLREHRA